ncbi:alpha/beta hydrolase fold domain-containing protein [Aquimarina algicola]|uniref:Alpha/beta hydrolase n=1 Tax=Aquimarina algicola TaxID=2589995 RepID=A0A504JD17_9FLAO|nr:alpha/beta hydrolase [Aquimarina algicola]TPN88906.1 alpha/beta hydrolase [Aquimarina algicola]
MKQSLTYHLTLLVIKLKGLKKNFSKDPIDFKKIRKEDVHQPKGKFFKQNGVRSFKISGSVITEIGRADNSDKLLIFIHGGAFISGPGKHHWDTIQEIAKQTNYTIWMCNYPKAPEHKISEISENIDAIYTTAQEQYQASQITLIGDSVGGTLVTALIQRLVEGKKELPNKIILICPVMDATMSNPDIEKVDAIDPMLSKKGILSAKKMCAENNDLKNVMISPIYGSFEQFPETVLFLAENDIMYPDQKLVVQKLKKTNTNVMVIEGKSMPHIWPFLPIMKEAQVSLKEIIKILNDA